MSDTYQPTPGSVRIVATSPTPMDAHAEVMQTDGTWLPLRICSITTHVEADKMNTATIVIEPSSIDQIVLLDSYAVARVDAPPPSRNAVFERVVADLRAYADSTLGPNATLSGALDTLR